MSYRYGQVDDLEGKPKVGTKQCVALVKQYAKCPETAKWKEGVKVKGATILKGTAIATFVDGKYPSHGTGNHAGLYVGQDANGITIMDQWADDVKKPTISSRALRFTGPAKKGHYPDASNNGDAYSVID